MNGAPRSFSGWRNAAGICTQRFLGGGFLPFSEMRAVSEEVLKRSSGFFPPPLPLAVKLAHVLGTLRVPAERNIRNFAGISVGKYVSARAMFMRRAKRLRFCVRMSNRVSLADSARLTKTLSGCEFRELKGGLKRWSKMNGPPLAA